MRRANVLYKDELAGVLTQNNEGTFIFEYTNEWFNNSNKNAISLTLPKNKQTHHSKFLFPFFYNLLPEGINKEMICKSFKIDLDDAFGLLMIIAKNDSIGAIKVQKIK